jgi:phosphoglucosamine mutase
MLEGALVAGFNSVGVNVVSVGVAPTPAVAFLARTRDFGLGGIISASHNPAPDNGIKFVDHNGRKLTDKSESSIEALLDGDFERPVGAALGSSSIDLELLDHYLAFLESIVPERLDGMKVAVDGAHGAAFALGPSVLRKLGAEVRVTGVSPDGININAEGGATKPATIEAFTSSTGYEVGVAFDGDADRAVFADSKGRLINGDRMMAVWAAFQQAQNALDPAAVVGTVMSNGGFETFLRSNGIELHRAQVGDKYVSEKLAELGAQIGGEQSGHIVFPHHGPTGDGLVTLLEFLRVLKRSGRSAEQWYDAYQPWPQVLYNLKVQNPKSFSQHSKVVDVIEESEGVLAGRGRLNVRASGTQPVLRVMVEASQLELRDQVGKKLVDAILAEMGGEIEGTVDLTYSLGD